MKFNVCELNQLGKVMKKLLYFGYISLVIACVCSPALAYETKEDFDRDFKKSVNNFLEERSQKYITFRNISAFMEKHRDLLKEYKKFCIYDPSDPNHPWFGIMKEIESFSSTGMDAFETFFCVGPKKALSNLPTHTFILNEEIKSAIESWAAEMGYKTYISADPGKVGALWVFDPDTLGNLLTINSALLKEHNVSQDPSEFIQAIDKSDLRGLAPFDLSAGKTRMYQLIARAFGREISLEEIENMLKNLYS